MFFRKRETPMPDDPQMLSRSAQADGGPDEAATEIVKRADAEGLRTVRLSFADQHGLLRGKSVTLRALPSALRNGITAPSTLLLKDPSHRTVFPVWGEDAGFGANVFTGAGDVLIVPDPKSFRVLPWAQHTGWLLCDVMTVDREPISFASRTVLARAVEQLAQQGFSMMCGLEIEFHIFKVDDDRLQHAETGMPGRPPHTRPLTRSYELLGETRYDTCAEILDILHRHCDELELPVRSIETEFGPSQFEFVLDPADPMTQADALVLFRSMVKQVCQRRGLHATFMCRPNVPNAAASGWHIHQSLIESASGHNAFEPEAPGQLTPTASAWIAGLLAHAAESCAITTPTVNGYRRYQPHQLAPDRIQWGHDNKGAMIRALLRHGDPASRIENRVPEPAANPHYVIASQILSGLSGLRRKLEAPQPSEQPYDANADALPGNLFEAIQAFEQGDLYAGALGEDFKRYYATLKRAEWNRYISTLSEWEHAEYFSTF